MGNNSEFSDIFNDSASSGINIEPKVESHKKQPKPNGVTPKSSTDIDTYSDDELTDVNAIVTNIPDNVTPVAIFFGPSSSGKTMALLRMIRFFKNDMDFTVQAERVFRPSHDRHYSRMCDNLNQMVNDQFAPKNTDVISFMLVKVFDRRGRAILQILEAPGEHYFDETDPNAPFPAYIQNIIHNIPNRKIWVYFAEQDWKDQTDRNNYATKIRMMQALTPRDKVVFLFNKCDKQMHQYNRNGFPQTELFLRTVAQQYPGIFTSYSNSGIAKLFFGPYKFSAVCFSSGVFSPTATGRQTWTLGNSSYCRALWRALTNK